MSDIVETKYHELIEGLDARAARISAFEYVRDIPYAVVPGIRNRHEGPTKILDLGCGSCTPKHFLLGRMFALMGLKVRYLTFPFSWDQPSLPYPDALRMLATGIPTEYHLALHVLIDDRWALVDATWDAPLAKHGFPVNASWDGTSDTRVALQYLEMIVHETATERDEFVAKAKSTWRGEDQAREDTFVKELNAWLETLRDEKKPSA